MAKFNRKERRVREKVGGKPPMFVDILMHADGRELTTWQLNDLNWFIKHPHCSFHLRAPHPGEYEPPEVPPPDAWLSLVHIRRAGGAFGISRIEQCPLAPSPADGPNYVIAMQATTKGQEALRAIWNDYPKEVFHA
ncbi:hypothetical protein LY100_002743 [Salmonella enterica]|nr:hypothetical protein [Salmonella enterica]